ncbi:MAG TPA: MBL fold metallo-hydrolase [Ilumatobacteraceae bacterium]
MSESIDVTWLGHSSVDLTVGGVRILTDPVLRMRIGHLRRRCPRPVLAAGPIDAVLISHLHHDHLDLPSLQRLAGGPLVVPRGAGALLGRIRGHDIVEVEPGDTVDVGDARIHVVHAQNRGNRTLSRVHGPPLGFVIEAAGQRVYFPGDTDLFDDMQTFGPMDLALLPIWGWGPRLGPGHLNPYRAAEAAALLEPRFVVPIHWGTFTPINVIGRPAWLDRPGKDFAAAMTVVDPAMQLVTLEPGSSTQIAGAV